MRSKDLDVMLCVFRLFRIYSLYRFFSLYSSSYEKSIHRLQSLPRRIRIPLTRNNPREALFYD